MFQIAITLDNERLAKLDKAAACLGSTREEALNQAIDNFATYWQIKKTMTNGLAGKLQRASRLLMLANFFHLPILIVIAKP